MSLPHAYCISGLTVASEFPLPGAIPAEAYQGSPHVKVSRSPVPERLEDGARLGPNWDMAGEDFLLKVPRLARFLIRGGNEIRVDLEEGATEYDASAYVLGTAFGILLHQRGALVLHGAAVARNGEAIAICGHSGAGKSTLAAALCQNSCTFVTDDICAVSLDGADHPIVLPDGRQLKLWQESIEKLDLAEHRRDSVYGRFEKYFIAPQEAAPTPLPLRAIYVLQESRRSLTDGITALNLPDAMMALDREAYRPGLRLKMGSRPDMVMQGAKMLSHAKVFRLIRPRLFDKMTDTVDLLLAHWDGLAS